MADVEMAAANNNSKSKEGKEDIKPVPCCVDPITFLLNLGRWRDLIGGLFLSITTTIALGLAAVCYQGVDISESYDTCPVVSMASCAIIVFSNFMIWRSGNINIVYAALEKDKDELQVASTAIREGINTLNNDTRILRETAAYLKKTARNMTSIQRQMKSNTNEMTGKMKFLKKERKDLGSSLEAITAFLNNLGDRDEKFKDNIYYLYDQFDILARYLENLENARNKLSKENTRLELIQESLKEKLQEFQTVRDDILNSDQWANNVFEMASYLEQRYIQLVELTTNYERNYIMQVVHQCEFIDGQPGWNESKVHELCERLPANCPEDLKEQFLENFKLVKAANLDEIIDYKTMEKLVKEQIIPYTDAIVKEDAIETSEETSSEQGGSVSKSSYDVHE